MTITPRATPANGHHHLGLLIRPLQRCQRTLTSDASVRGQFRNYLVEITFLNDVGKIFKLLADYERRLSRLAFVFVGKPNRSYKKVESLGKSGNMLPGPASGP